MEIHAAGPAPVKPQVRAYGVFIQEESKKMKKKGSAVGERGSVFKELGPKWKTLSAAERESYEKKAQANKLKNEVKIIIKPKIGIHNTDPTPVKPQIRAYGIFIQEESEKMKKKGSVVMGDRGSFLKVLGPKWKTLSAKEREPYEKKAQANKLKKTLSATEREPYEKKAQANKLIKPKMGIHDAGPAPLKPQVNAYGIFIQDESEKMKKKGSAVTGDRGSVFKELGPKWKTLSAAEREPYEKKAQANKFKYKKELDAWKAKIYSM